MAKTKVITSRFFTMLHAKNYQNRPMFQGVIQQLTKSPAITRVGPTVLVVTDLEGHPRSMIFISSERAKGHFLLVINSNLGPIYHSFQDMASFPLKNIHFSYPFHSTPN